VEYFFVNLCSVVKFVGPVPRMSQAPPQYYLRIMIK